MDSKADSEFWSLETWLLQWFVSCYKLDFFFSEWHKMHIGSTNFKNYRTSRFLVKRAQSKKVQRGCSSSRALIQEGRCCGHTTKGVLLLFW